MRSADVSRIRAGSGDVRGAAARERGGGYGEIRAEGASEGGWEALGDEAVARASDPASSGETERGNVMFMYDCCMYYLINSRLYLKCIYTYKYFV